MSAAENGEEKKTRRGENPLADEVKLADWYRRKADECLRLAQEAANEDMRDQWLKLANGWSQLALHVKR